MPRRELPFGETVIGVELPERTQFVQPGADGGRLPPAANEAQAVRDALAAPLASDPISARVKPGAKVLIAFDDPTVPSYGPIRRLAIEAVLDELARAGVDEQNVLLVCANALHRKWTNEELSTGLGDDLIKRFGQRLACHDAEDADNLVHLGVTPEGYDVEVHKLVVDCDLVVYVNAGYYLGFGGGWKSVCVGLSTWKSIRWTHTPDGMSMSLHKNRMHAVFDKMGVFLEQQLGPKVFKIESVLANPFQISRVFAGAVNATRHAAIDLLATVNVPRRSGGEPADVVIYGVPNWSPYATFATMNPILTLISSGLGYLGGHIEARGKPGCSVILATPARDEWDMTHHPAYREVWDTVLTDTLDPYVISDRYIEDFATRAEYIEHYRHGVAFHPVHAILATHPLKRLKHAGRVFAAGAENPAIPERLGYTPTATVEEAIRQAEAIHGPECSLVCVEIPTRL